MQERVACVAYYGERVSHGQAWLEGDRLRFSGDFDLTIRFMDVQTVTARRGLLMVALSNDDGVTLELPGPVTEAWASQIRYPRPLLDKLGVKPGACVSVLNVADADFWAQLRARTSDIGVDEVLPESDVIVLGVTQVAALAALADLQPQLRRDGVIWVVWPKGQPHIRENDVRAAALTVGLVDVKVVRFSDRLSGLKLVIPRARR